MGFCPTQSWGQTKNKLNAMMSHELGEWGALQQGGPHKEDAFTAGRVMGQEGMGLRGTTG